MMKKKKRKRKKKKKKVKNNFCILVFVNDKTWIIIMYFLNFVQPISPECYNSIHGEDVRKPYSFLMFSGSMEM